MSGGGMHADGMQAGKGRPRNRSLRRQLALLIAVSLALLLLVQCFCLAFFTELTKQRAFHYAQDSLSQISRQITALFEDVERLVSNVSFSSSMQEYLTTRDSGRKYVELYPILSAMLQSMCASNNNIYDILLFNEQGTLSLSRQQAHSADIYAQMQMPTIQEKWTKPLAMPAIVYGNAIYYPFVQPIYGISVQSGFMSRIGTCVVLCDGDSVQSLVSGISIAKDAQLYVRDPYGMVIASNQPEDIGALTDAPGEGEGLGETRVRKSDGRECIVQHEAAGDFTVWSVVPVASLLEDMERAMQLCVIISVVAVCLLLLTGISISRHVTQSVARIVRFLKEVAEGHVERRIHVEQLDEITQIAQSANQMLDRLEESKQSILKAQSELYEAKLLNRQAQFTALQRQINPHFLFNTLNCIAGIAAVRDVPEVVRIASSMGHIFRYCIKGADVVTLREEIACVRSYLDIVKERFHGKIRGDIWVEGDIQEARMPKMILQPIVENAVFHGLEPKRGGGSIDIRARRLGEDMIAFEIADDGKGMDAPTLAALRQSLRDAGAERVTQNKSSIGLVNIAARVRFLLGERARIEVEAAEDEGSRITLYIPATHPKTAEKFVD